MKSYKYENLQIGNFLVSIGFYLGQTGHKFPISLNQYQQTFHNDYTIGDLFGQLSGKYFIIELKKDFASTKSELQKPQRKVLIESLCKIENKHLLHFSINAHLLCYPAKENDHLDFNLLSYFSVFNSEINGWKLCGVPLFVDKLMTHKNLGCNFTDIEKYINLLKECAGKPNYSASGILINYNEKEGFKYIEFDNLNFLEQKLQLEIGISPEIKKENNMGLGR